MPRRRPPGRPSNHQTTRSFTTTIIPFLFLIPLIAAAQQQHPHDALHRPKPAVDAIVQRGRSTHVEADRPNHHRDDVYSNNKNTHIAAHDERAIVALASAPAAQDAAVRAPSKPAASSPGGLSSRPRARSLQDWQVEDFVLLATVDGQIHARDRATGKERWSFSVGRPMVDTSYDHLNISEDDPDSETFKEMPLWIVEPSQDGNLYVYSHGSSGIQKLGMTVRDLAEDLAPFAGDNPPVVYTADKKTTLYTVDARTGNILKRFSSGGSSVFNDTNCERLGDFVPSNQECKGTLTLGQTEYIIGIQSKKTARPLCTIKYFEWTPNVRDRDLHSQYLSTMDNKYVYSKHDGTIFALDHTTYRKIYPQRPVYIHKFSSPVVRVFDVARQHEDDSDNPNLIILPQPAGPASADEMVQDVWVNCTESGTWYAMSEFSYPAVTDGASKAKCYTEATDLFVWDGDHALPESKSLVGVHSLASNIDDIISDMPTISAPDGRDDTTIGGAPPAESPNEVPTLPQTRHASSWLATGLGTLILLILIPWMFQNSRIREALAPLNKLIAKKEKVSPHPPAVQEVEAPIPVLVEEPAPLVEERRVRFMVDSEEVKPEDEPPVSHGRTDSVTEEHPAPEAPEAPEVIPVEEPPTIVPADTQANPEEDGNADANDGGEGAGDDNGDASQETPKKKKAHRGQRGGRKRRKNTKSSADEGPQDEISKIVEQVKNMGQIQSFQPDVLSNGESVTDIANNIKRLGKLTIYTDKVIGNGSGGTFVFEGKWKEREVAVKRMLPQYYGLAEQEVSLLQQSDLHPNVIRYFDDEKDQDFLWIALELCQASLWDLFKDGHHDEPLPQSHCDLVTEINTDVPRALHQLAAGLNHLHNLRIIHRDIKPQNILIAYPQKNQKGGPRLVISDFGLCKTLPDNVSTLVGTTTNAGTIGWKAPELIVQPKEIEGRNGSAIAHSRESSSSTDPVSQGVKRAVDIFSLGCVFYYVLTNGSHPFDDEEGWMQIRELNIKKNKLNFSRLDYLGDDIEEPIDLLYNMLAPMPEDRPTALQVMGHPFFWSPEKRLAFLCDVSDHWEREPRGEPTKADGTPALANGKMVVNDGGPSQDLLCLEYHADAIMRDPMHPYRELDFLARLDKKFIDTLGKQRKYSGHKVLDLLRALRNKKNHYEDMPPDVKAKVGPLPGGYLRYWTSKFPKLLIECYHCVLECGLQDRDRFRPYFTANQF